MRPSLVKPRYSHPLNLSVVVVNDFCHVQGGASRVAIDEAVGLSNAGLDVTFFGAVGPISPELQAAKVKVVVLNLDQLSNVGANRLVALQGLWNSTASAELAKLLSTMDRGAAVVHVHGYTKALSSSVFHAAVRSGFTVVCTLHDFFSACPTGAFFNFQQNDLCPLRGLSLSCVSTNCDKRRYSHKLYRVARSLVQKHMGRFPGEIREFITLSRKSSELLLPYLPSNARVHKLENPIDVARATPVDVGSNQRLMVVGRLDTEKGIRETVDAARNTGASITFIGDGPLRGYAEDYEGSLVTGWVSGSRVMEVLEQARALVFPSLWYETYGLVVDEASARGIPSIVSDVTAAAERVMDGVTGWHVRAGSVPDLERSFGLIKSDAVVRAAGKNAYDQYWKEPRSPEVHTQGLLRIYAKVLV
jgi:glycosyltransferase involved in cell wall biosynthesis